MIRRRTAFRPSTLRPDLLKAGSGPVFVIARIKGIIKERARFVKRKNDAAKKECPGCKSFGLSIVKMDRGRYNGEANERENVNEEAGAAIGPVSIAGAA